MELMENRKTEDYVQRGTLKGRVPARLLTWGSFGGLQSPGRRNGSPTKVLEGKSTDLETRGIEDKNSNRSGAEWWKCENISGG